MRISQAKGREGESCVSPAAQRARIRAACERDGLRLVDVFDELDVSGGTPLDERSGLGPAVRAVESGEAEVIAAAYFDRLFPSLAVQAEAVDRVERAGGRVLAVDVGRVTNGSARQWLSGTMVGAVSEYARRTAAERSAAQSSAVSSRDPTCRLATSAARTTRSSPGPATAPAMPMPSGCGLLGRQ